MYYCLGDCFWNMDSKVEGPTSHLIGIKLTGNDPMICE